MAFRNGCQVARSMPRTEQTIRVAADGPEVLTDGLSEHMVLGASRKAAEGRKGRLAFLLTSFAHPAPSLSLADVTL
jgi:hypothetical protein